MNYTELMNRIGELKSRKGRGSISADETFSLLMELAEKTRAVDINAGSLTVRRVYASVAAMNADQSPMDQETGKALKFGQLVCVCNPNDLASPDNGKIYRYNKPGWEFLRQVGDMVQFARTEEVNGRITRIEHGLNTATSIVRDIDAPFTARQVQAIKAIKDIQIYNSGTGKAYEVTTLVANDDNYPYSMIIADRATSESNQIRLNHDTTVAWTSFTNPSGVTFRVCVDWTGLSGIVINEFSDNMILSGACYKKGGTETLNGERDSSPSNHAVGRQLSVVRSLLFDPGVRLTDAQVRALDCVRDVNVYGGDPDIPVYITTLVGGGNTAFPYRVMLSVGGKSVTIDQVGTPSGAGLTRKSVTAGGVIYEVLTDWAGFHTAGIIINGLTPELRISKLSFKDKGISPPEIDGMRGRISTLEGDRDGIASKNTGIKWVDTVNGLGTTRYGSDTITGWGFPVGIRKKISRVQLFGGFSGGTVIRIRVREEDASGALLFDKRFPLSEDIDLGETVENQGGARLWMEMFVDGTSKVMRTGASAVIYTEGEGYPMVRYTVDPAAIDTGYLGNYAGRLDIKVRFYCEVTEYSVRPEVLPQPKGETGEVRTRGTANVIFSGSSITWGDGRLMGSFVGNVSTYIQEGLSSLYASDSDRLEYSGPTSTLTNELLYGGRSSRIAGIGARVRFKMYGDEIAICQVRERTADFGIMTLRADGVTIGSFDNKNGIGTNVETFTGENVVKVRLRYPATFNHRIKVNGRYLDSSDIAINTGGYGGVAPADKKAFVYRLLDPEGKPTHGIEFKGLGVVTEVEVSYSHGRIVCHERSARGQLNDGVTNESAYGSGKTSFDPANPSGGLSSGMEFRSVDRRAFHICKFTEARERVFEIEITGGTNPYLNLNYVTNRFHNLMNAGIGGWTVSALTNNDRINDYTQFYDWFMPDTLFQESATNDDWSQPTRRLSRSLGELTKDRLLGLDSLEVSRVTYNPVTDRYAVEMATGIIAEITPFSLRCPEITGSATRAGDVIRIGNYFGDNRQTACREIDTVDLVSGLVTWLQPLNPVETLNVDTLDDLVGAECCIRDLSDYQSRYEDLVDKVRKVSPHCAIRVVQPGLANYFLRQLWGYDIVHRRLCARYTNVRTVEITDWLRDFQDGHISGRNKQLLTATGASEYMLDRTGHWQGFRVLVNGIDVYGRDCYVRTGWTYRCDPSKSGAALNKRNVYDNYGVAVVEAMRLVFPGNIPGTGDTIEVQFADNVWSNDYCHPNRTGNYVYAQKYCDEIGS